MRNIFGELSKVYSEEDATGTQVFGSGSKFLSYLGIGHCICIGFAAQCLDFCLRVIFSQYSDGVCNNKNERRTLRLVMTW